MWTRCSIITAGGFAGVVITGAESFDARTYTYKHTTHFIMAKITVAIFFS